MSDIDDDTRALADDARSVPLSEIFALLDLDLAKGTWDEGFAFSIYRDERTPSLHVSNDEVWHDFGTGKGGDGIRLVQEHFGCSFMRAVQFITAGVDPAAVRVERTKKEEAHIPDLSSYYSETVQRHQPNPRPDLARDWTAKKWGVSPAFLTEAFSARVLDIAGDLQLWAPHYTSQGRLSGIKIRHLRDGSKSSVTGSRWPELYTGRQRPGPDSVWLVEGESDCWALTSVTGPNVYGLPSGAGTWREEWAVQLKQHTKVSVALDGDDAGQTATEKICLSLERHGVNHKVVNVPGGRVAEALMGAWKP